MFVRLRFLLQGRKRAEPLEVPGLADLDMDELKEADGPGSCFVHVTVNRKPMFL